MAHDAPETQTGVQRLLDARRELEKNGLEVETVSTAGGAMDGVTEVRAAPTPSATCATATASSPLPVCSAP